MPWPADLVARAGQTVRLTAKRALNGITKPGAVGKTAAGKTAAGKTIVFLAGVHRSGTNITMEVLERHPRTDVFHEQDSRAYFDYEMRHENVLHRLAERSCSSHIVFKALHETQKLPALLRRFKPADGRCLGVWLYRHYGDVVNSILVRWPGSRNRIDEMVEDPRNGEWRGQAITPETLTILRAHYRPDLNDASANALFWWLRNRPFFEHGFDTDPRMTLVRYETLVTEPLAELTRLTGFLGLALTPAMSRMLSPRSIGKNPAPAIAPDVATLCDEMWERLEAVWQG